MCRALTKVIDDIFSLTNLLIDQKDLYLLRIANKAIFLSLFYFIHLSFQPNHSKRFMMKKVFKILLKE